MDDQDSLATWTASVDQFLFLLSKPIRQALATFSLAMTLAHHCHSNRIAAATPTDAEVASSRRRMERLLCNGRFKADLFTASLVQSLAQAWPNRRWTLIIDETDRDEKIRSMQILLAYKHRAIPLAVRAYKSTFGKGRRPRLLFALLKLIRKNLPANADVTVLCDRGLAWPDLVRLLQRWNWHYVLRIQGQTRVWPDDAENYSRADALLPQRRGRAFTAHARVFKNAKWLECYFTAIHAKGDKQPGYLISDRPGATRQYRQYGQRTWCEEAFRDEKSGGFCWRESRVNKPKHITRLLMVMLLAMYLCLMLGAQAVKRGERRRMDPHSMRLWSYFKIGMTWLMHQLVANQRLPPLPVPLVPV
jgi:hypothetical protein